MTLREFIKKRGELPIANDLGVSIDTVRSWRYGNREPRPKVAKKLIILSDQNLNWEDIYGSLKDEV
jgi:DNA-binding transcriptional regulator YiaG|tara:strand:- start:2690 stop:2887 length:198 start_codon:yes stop_codon:yes gene_type:complete